jgi:hypothetical protein
MTVRLLTRDQVEAWNSRWSFSDCQIVRQHLDRLGARTFYVPPSGGYIGCIDAKGTRVMFIHAGYLLFKRELAADFPPEGWKRGLPLSTFSPHASPDFEGEPDYQFCEIHNIAIPATGICDDCVLSQ